MNTALQQSIIKFTQYAKPNRPIIAAHRGLSSLYPENSIPGFLAAFQYSDYIELDVVLSKEYEVIVCHDTFLSKVSDVGQKQEFQDRKSKRVLYKEEKEDWWISDFTVQELKSLRLRQCILQRKSEFDWMSTFPTLEETLKAVEQYNRENNTNKGVLIEIKDDVYHKEYVKTEIALHVQKVLKSLGMDTISNTVNRIPIMIMAFDSSILRYFQQQSDLPRVYLLWADDKNLPEIESVAQLGDVIGLDLRLIWDKKSKSLGSWIQQAQQVKLPIFGWTFQNDCQEMKDLFETSDIESIYKKCSFLDGIITEFPQKMN